MASPPCTADGPAWFCSLGCSSRCRPPAARARGSAPGLGPCPWAFRSSVALRPDSPFCQEFWRVVFVRALHRHPSLLSSSLRKACLDFYRNLIKSLDLLEEN